MRIEKVVLVSKGVEMSRSTSEQPSGQYERADVPKMKRKRSNLSCHQCHKNNRGLVSRCNCCNKGYCNPCVNKWYSKIKEVLFVEGCPFCRKFCNCGACLQKKGSSKNKDLDISHEEKTDLLAYIINVLLPSLSKQVDAEAQGIKVFQLLERAVSIVRLYESAGGQLTLPTSCSCLPCDVGGNDFFRASSREDETENFIYSPIAA